MGVGADPDRGPAGRRCRGPARPRHRGHRRSAPTPVRDRGGPTPPGRGVEGARVDPGGLEPGRRVRAGATPSTAMDRSQAWVFARPKWKRMWLRSPTTSPTTSANARASPRCVSASPVVGRLGELTAASDDLATMWVSLGRLLLHSLDGEEHHLFDVSTGSPTGRRPVHRHAFGRSLARPGHGCRSPGDLPAQPLCAVQRRRRWGSRCDPPPALATSSADAHRSSPAASTDRRDRGRRRHADRLQLHPCFPRRVRGDTVRG